MDCIVRYQLDEDPPSPATSTVRCGLENVHQSLGGMKDRRSEDLKPG